MLSKMALTGGLAAVAMAGSAHAGLLYSNDFDGSELRGAGVSGGFFGLGNEGAVAGFWNAAGWAGTYGGSRGGLVDGAVADFTGLSLTGLAPHTHIKAGFILGFLDSWDSTDGDPRFAPDRLEIFIDGAKVADLTYNNAGGTAKTTGGGVLLSDGMGRVSEYVRVNNDTQTYPDTLVDMSTAPFLSFAHTGSSLNLLFRAAGAGWQGGDDEGYGLDNVVLTYDGVRAPPGGVPEPTSWALMIAGFGLAGTALRRRRQLVAG